MSYLRAMGLGLAILTLTSSAAMAMQATARMQNAAGDAIGTATLTQTPHGVLIQIDLTGISRGAHGFHVHEAGACSPDFKAAGGHFNPDGKGHGLNHPNGSHAGDMPNVFAAADGTVKAEVLNAKITLGSGAGSVFDSDGSAIVIHAKPDSHGEAAGAGDRVACGVITR